MVQTMKAELLAAHDKTFLLLDAFLERVPASLAPEEDSHGLSIKALLAERGHWIHLFLGWYGDDQAGRHLHFPAPGYSWEDRPRFSADLREWQAALSWRDVLFQFRERSLLLHAQIKAMDEFELFDRVFPGAPVYWTVGRWAEECGVRSFNSTRDYIEERLGRLVPA